MAAPFKTQLVQAAAVIRAEHRFVGRWARDAEGRLTCSWSDDGEPTSRLTSNRRV
jgi:hypothetical protein